MLRVIFLHHSALGEQWEFWFYLFDDGRLISFHTINPSEWRRIGHWWERGSGSKHVSGTDRQTDSAEAKAKHQSCYISLFVCSSLWRADNEAPRRLAASASQSRRREGDISCWKSRVQSRLVLLLKILSSPFRVLQLIMSGSDMLLWPRCAKSCRYHPFISQHIADSVSLKRTHVTHILGEIWNKCEEMCVVEGVCVCVCVDWLEE